MSVAASPSPTPQHRAAGLLTVQVVAPDGVRWSGNARGVTVPSVSGSLGILPRHEPVAAVLAAGVVRVRPATGDPVEVTVTGGFVVVDDDEVSVLADGTVAPGDA
ncbi:MULTISPECIES: ATP synthase F1 subunit epsilon [Cellulomonas]|uniref:ATP synthase epsilon chain n=1 Tax=Cellulomonas iranensis TaxID=76862 RepID=A0ABU0GL30_9CELL|nr:MULTISPECIES: ATP synthase F1 subunit epsilon [Cellulomonas]MDQ0425287.1 F-type H+-transporting ATPase subunit epsilon [Cellulomonas iranensis]